MLKHTAVVASPGDPGAGGPALGASGPGWTGRIGLSGRVTFPERTACLALLGVIVAVAIWALTLFDCSPPMNRSAVERQTIGSDTGGVSPGKSLRSRSGAETSSRRALAGRVLPPRVSVGHRARRGWTPVVLERRTPTTEDRGAISRSSRLTRCRSESVSSCSFHSSRSGGDRRAGRSGDWPFRCWAGRSSC